MFQTTPQRSRRAGFRPTIEVLEDRNLLSGGTLDPTFGSGGVEIFHFRPGDWPSSPVVAAQADGKLVVAGGSTIYPSTGGQSSLVVARLNSDGSLDTSFGTNGEVFLPTTIVGDSNFAMTPDGKIVVEASNSSDVYLARLNQDGSFDVSFAGTGSETIGTSWPDTVLPRRGYFNTLSIQPDGKIILAGAAAQGFLAARINGDGTIDSSFGYEGEVVVPAEYGSDVSSVAIQPDGKLILAGEVTLTHFFESFTEPGPIQFPLFIDGSITVGAVARLNADGSLDTGFGSGGMLLLPAFSEITSVAVRTDGEILAAGGSDDLRNFLGTSGIIVVAAGQTAPSENWGLVTLLTADGSVDTSFGNAGFVVPPGQALVSQVLVRSDGSMVLLGESYPVNGSWGWTVSLLRADGSPDPDYGTNGQVSTSSFPVSSGLSFVGPAGLSIQPDGDIVFGDLVASGINQSFQESVLLARLTATPVGAPLPPKPPGHHRTDDQPPQLHVDPVLIVPVPVGSTGSREEPRLPAPVFVVVKESGTSTTRHDSIVAVVIPPADAGLLTFATTKELLSLLFSRGPSGSVVGLPWELSHDPSHRPGVNSGVPPLPSGGGAGGDTPDDTPKPLAVPVGSLIDLPPSVAAAFAVSLPLMVDPAGPDSDADVAPVSSASTESEASDSEGTAATFPADSDD